MFRTIVDIKPSPFKISYEDKILTFGSCFSDNIGNKLKDSFLITDINPFGVLYNPASIQNSIQVLLNKKKFVEGDLFQSRNLWNSYAHSTLFSSPDVNEVLSNINSRIDNAINFVNDGSVLLITFGTAWVFEHVENKTVVSNCHKQPASVFYRKRLDVEQIVNSFALLFDKLRLVNPDLRIVLTVSPIRHWKDGANENNVSKAILLLAVNELQSIFSFVHYFPAYEIMLDELRDYRFYADDMFHPSTLAINYIWQRFTETYFSVSDRELIKKLEQLQKDMQHRPIHPESPEMVGFESNLRKRKSDLIKEYPFLTGRF